MILLKIHDESVFQDQTVAYDVSSDKWVYPPPPLNNLNLLEISNNVL